MLAVHGQSGQRRAEINRAVDVYTELSRIGLGEGANVYLTSAELAAVGALLGKLPTPDEYLEYAHKIDSMADEIYRYMNFDQVVAFQKLAEDGERIAATIIDEVA
jgi:aconitate hydratase 2/2-methylisocitrate dehydratase